MGVNYSILFSITSFFRPAIHKSMAARQAQIDDLIRKQGLGPGHNRGYARINPDAFPRLVGTFKESVLNGQPLNSLYYYVGLQRQIGRAAMSQPADKL